MINELSRDAFPKENNNNIQLDENDGKIYQLNENKNELDIPNSYTLNSKSFSIDEESESGSRAKRMPRPKKGNYMIEKLNFEEYNETIEHIESLNNDSEFPLIPDKICNLS